MAVVVIQSFKRRWTEEFLAMISLSHCCIWGGHPLVCYHINLNDYWQKKGRSSRLILRLSVILDRAGQDLIASHSLTFPLAKTL